jgi:hypothetical protein
MWRQVDSRTDAAHLPGVSAARAYARERASTTGAAPAQSGGCTSMLMPPSPLTTATTKSRRARPTAIAADLMPGCGCSHYQTALATAEPKALRYRLLHVPARLTHSARRRKLRIPASWNLGSGLFARIAAIPLSA